MSLRAAGRYAKTATRAVATLSGGGGKTGLRDLSRFLAGVEDGGPGGDAPATADHRLRGIDLGDVWPGDRPVCLTELAGTSHNVNERELAVLVALANLAEANRMFVFGTYDGRTDVNLLRNRPDASLVTLDLPDEMVLGETLSSTAGGIARRLHGAPDVAGRFEQVRQRSDQFDPTPYVGTMDFIFVDAGHSYELVANDSKLARTMLKPNGIIAWHDYGHLRGYEPFAGLTRAVDEFFTTPDAPGVGVWFRGTRVAACMPKALLR